jgi:predicted TIM-barrel fold metal-dependent hydrolase
MEGKVALEEHFNNRHWNAKSEEERNGKAYAQDVERCLLDSHQCIEEMDRAGIERCILSLTSPGVQSVVDRKEAVELARNANDYAYELTQKHPERLPAFASVALQDPESAVRELERAVQSLGLKGVLINGYSNVGPEEEVQYLDEGSLEEFWSCVSWLNVPLYLHPREPLPSQTRSIRGYPELGGSAWPFAYETSTHAVRLMLSGVFDRYPAIQVIFGHLGEGLPFMISRLQLRLDEQREGSKGSRAKHRRSHYFASNFYVTTSGHFHTKPFNEAVEQIGVERILFSVDYPYEQMDVGARWFDDMRLENSKKRLIGRENADRLFSLNLGSLPTSAVAGFAS